MIIIDTIFLIVKNNYTYLSGTNSNTKDFPTQDIFYPNPEMNLSIKII